MSNALVPGLESLAVSPVVQFPQEAEAGKTYLFTIDLSPRQAFDSWPYADSEEVIVYCQINAAPIFHTEPLGESAVVIHRFGGTYGPARFLITAAAEPQDGVIRITLISGLGVPLKSFETPTISVRAKVDVKQPLELRVGPRPHKETADRTISVPEVEVPEVSVARDDLADVVASTPKPPERQARIFVSSVYQDEKYRDAVYGALRAMEQDVVSIAHESYRNTYPIEKSYADIDSCDLYVGVFGWRYGTPPKTYHLALGPADNPDKKSITELEYRRAFAQNKPCLIFMLDEKRRPRSENLDSFVGKKNMESLRKELKSKHIVIYFKDPKDLAKKVLAAVHNWVAEKDKTPVLDASVTALRTVKVEGTPNLEIPDNTTSGVTHSLSVTSDGRIKRLTVAVDITHSFIGDLFVSLISPTGKTVVLHARIGGSADNIVRTYSSEDFPALTTLLGDQAKGEWQLLVADLGSADVGKLRRWGLEMNLELTNQTADQDAPGLSTQENMPAWDLSPDRISIGRLPVTGRYFFGRESELAMLDKAWDGAHIRVVNLVAWGGAGKSAIVNKWLSLMADDNFRGAERVFGWSFYSQGTNDLVASSDLFIDQALRWFGDPDPTLGTPWEKGERLAQLVSRQRTLLVLDGLEPLQYPPGPDEGSLRDSALKVLLRQLAAHNQGLCVITSRAPITDLDSSSKAIVSIDLNLLSPKDGAEALRAKGVKGSQEELEQASQEYGGHPLSLAILGSYLADAFNGDITRRWNIGSLEEEELYGRHAQRVMASYELWFRERPELGVLRLLSLFDRPATQGELAVLRSAPVISGVTDKLVFQSEQRWQTVLSALRRSDLVTASNPDEPLTLTTHPLVREHFSRQLRKANPDAWRECHRRLYEYLSRTAKELPETLEELRLLYAAVYHGCQAGKHQEVLDDVYSRRIQRGIELYSIKKLGAFQTDLAAIANFFEQPWEKLVEGLSDNSRGYILNAASFDLRALGRPVEAAQPLKASFEISVEQQNWDNAAGAADRLASLYLNIGDIVSALSYAQEAAVFAEREGNTVRMLLQRVNYGRALQQAGRLQEAESSFREAESKSARRGLPSSLTFFYNTLLLDLARYLEVQERAEQALRSGQQQESILDQSFASISLGQALIGMHLQRSGDESLVREATLHLSRGLEGLRRAGQAELLPYGLLARAELHRVTGEFELARKDLNETMSIATHGSMKLHEADCHLEFARLFLAMAERDSARDSLQRAKQLIEGTGYHRRDNAVRGIEEQLGETIDKEVTARNTVLIVYSHRDKSWVDRLTNFLKPIIRDGVISFWSDTAIETGTKWTEELKRQLLSAKVALLMVSPDFLASDLINREDLSPLFEIAEKSEPKLFWVALRPSMYSQTLLGKFQAINDPSRPLSGLTTARRDSELLRIAEAVQAGLRS